jgi:uncharacterized repeat protein (TIGR02543 family)
MNKHFPVFKFLLASVLFSGMMPTLAQADQVLKTLVDNHGSLAAGDVVFTNFRMPYVPPPSPGMLLFMGLGNTLPPPPNGADVSVRASVGTDGRINLVLTPIDANTGLPAPFLTNAQPGAALPTDILKYLEFDVVVTNPLRRLHAVDRAFGPGTTSLYGSSAYNWIYFFDSTNFNQYTVAAGSALLMNFDPYPLGAAALNGGDRAGARFGVQWEIASGDWGGIRIGTGSLDSITVRYSLADAVAPIAPVPVEISSFFADAVYLTGPAPAGGATVFLSVDDPSLLSIPSSVTVAEGSFYSGYRAVKQPVQNFALATVTGDYNLTVATASEYVWVGEAVGSGPLPTLSVTLSGKGKVTNLTRTLNCGTVCSITPLTGGSNGVAETLIATAGTGSTFIGWTGACSGTAPSCTVIVGGLVKVGATFTPTPSTGGGGGGGGTTTSNFTMKVSTGNPGTVTSNVGGINCGTACSATVAPGTLVTLTATPPVGKTFAGWSGARTGTGPSCTVTVNTNLSAKANFNK